jgi:dGTPase
VKEVSYDAFDRERFGAERHSSDRGDFQRDRGRLIHSSALRRLAQKTQVLSPTAGVDFARNRLTHSLEVAQVGREIGQALGLDPDVVDTACLAHDLGHPPFGHNGELALASWAADIGGFEGNAQTFRVLTRLEPKSEGRDARSLGLNLTRASLDAASKYPWFLKDRFALPPERPKFGVYDDDREVFSWLRRGIPEGVVSIEAQVMDLSDDIAYSVHDFEDAIVGGYLSPRTLGEEESVRALIHSGSGWAGEGIDLEFVLEAYRRLRALDQWPVGFEGSRADFAKLKNLTSSLIGRFAQSVQRAERPESANLPARYQVEIVLDRRTQAEITLLKAIVSAAVMGHETRQPLYAHQRKVLTELLDALSDHAETALEPIFLADFGQADDDASRRRVLVDQVASLTDQSAIVWHERLTGTRSRG